MSTMFEHPKHASAVQEGYSQYHAALAPHNNGTGGPSNHGEKSPAENRQAPESGNDEEAQINSELVTIWTQRLQVLTVVTAFLASMDGQLFSLTALNTQIGLPASTTSRETVYACLAGALIFHILATILAYVASFALVRYRIIEAIDEDEDKRHSRVVAEPLHPLQMFVAVLQTPARLRFLSTSRSDRPAPPPPVSLLTRSFYTTLALAAVGFILALTGILAYVWVALPTVVGIASTVCVGVGASVAVWAIAI